MNFKNQKLIMKSNHSFHYELSVNLNDVIPRELLTH